MGNHRRQALRPVGLAAIALTLCVFSAPQHSRVFAQEAKPGAGEFQAWCSRCHGLEGKGDGPIAKEIETRPPDLTQLSANNGGTFPAERVRKSIDGRSMEAGHGTRQMPVWGNWFAFDVTAGGLLKTDKAKTQEEIQERIGRITAYLKAIQR
ncbi:MAG: cytochrome c [Alphaproteobacteria bacterium]|nr:cytochrome c [Alphaproteobacteria bacterium]